ncbi:hypothetical protein PVL29_004996 [Vitis rotundifolia]|uniref:AP complex mu/sigma subunit domain-containing protein n=1 Tax=Vitis rotundifolia TaxID=103349 RepID=A0AA39A9F8_VITRO|nr:hypothetical protein PVL29_004996 [Vitis rotundifolia]
MIRAVIVMNTQGKPRLTKFYDYMPPEKQQELIRRVFGVLCSRAENVSNFVEADSVFGPDTRLVYKHYATLYFVFIFDSSENELAMLDLIQVLVETLDKCFKNVCELDIVFNYSKKYQGSLSLSLSLSAFVCFCLCVLVVNGIFCVSVSVCIVVHWNCVSMLLPSDAGWKQPQILSHSSLSPFLVGEVDSM